MIASLLNRTIEKLPPEVRLQGRILFLVDDAELVRRRASSGLDEKLARKPG